MSKLYTREELQNLPKELRKGYLNQVVNRYVQEIINAASNGKTSTVIEMLIDGKNCGRIQTWEKTPTYEEMEEILKERFPGCRIAYEEVWVEKDINTRVLKKGIVIDWS